MVPLDVVQVPNVPAPCVSEELVIIANACGVVAEQPSTFLAAS